jgi:hypothetical protein
MGKKFSTGLSPTSSPSPSKVSTGSLLNQEYDDERNAETFDSPLIRDLRQEMGLRGKEEVTGLRAMSLEELERKLMKRQETEEKIENDDLPSTSPPPPGMGGVNLGQAAPSRLLFSAQVNMENDKFKGFMNLYDRELVTKIHISQLRTEQPLIEDFYYQALVRKGRDKRHEEGNDRSHFLPLPRMTEHARQRRAQATPGGLDMKDLRKALGTITTGSSRKPRLRMTPPEHKAFNIDAGNAVMLIEACYTHVLTIEDVLLREEQDGMEPESKSQIINDAYQDISKYIGNPDRLAVILSWPKGRRLVGKALRLLHSTKGFGRIVMESLTSALPLLPFVRDATNKPSSDVEHFVDVVMTPLVPVLVQLTWIDLFATLNSILDNSLLDWVCKTKAGLVFTCIVLSRLELLKNTDPESDDATRFSTYYMDKIYQTLSDHLSEFFAFLPAAKNEPGMKPAPSVTSHSYYIWQFMALLALNIEDERKRAIVLELRERILAIVAEGERSEVKHLNVFLNALGLDAEQLK